MATHRGLIEQTTIHPAAWSDHVERDLWQIVCRARPAAQLDPDRPSDAFVRACADAAAKLAFASGQQVVALYADGTADVKPVPPHDYDAHERAHELARDAALRRAAELAEVDDAQHRAALRDARVNRGD